MTSAKLLLLWQKSYLWIALGLVVIVAALLFFRRRPNSPVQPAEIEALENAAAAIRTKMQNAETEAHVKVIRAQAKEEATLKELERVNAIDDQLERAKRLVELRKSVERS